MGDAHEIELRGATVALLGRLRSMPRQEAVALLQEAGARLARRPDARVVLYVRGVGCGQAPAPEVAAVSRARIVGEVELLELLGLLPRGHGLHDIETTAGAAEVPVARLRAWVRSGLLVPSRRIGRLMLFGYPELVAARELARLNRCGISGHGLRRSWRELRRWIGEPRRALGWLVAAGGSDRPLLRLPDGGLAWPDGQRCLGFLDDPETAPRTAGTLRDPDFARERFAAGLAAEERGDLDGAFAAYRDAARAGACDPELFFNLGNVCYGLGRRRAARRCFERATRIDPGYLEAWNNLGSTLIDLGHIDEAISCLRKALELDPAYADAHFNLAEALGAHGLCEEARVHWRLYLRYDPTSVWAERARERLTEEE